MAEPLSEVSLATLWNMRKVYATRILTQREYNIAIWDNSDMTGAPDRCEESNRASRLVAAIDREVKRRLG